MSPGALLLATSLVLSFAGGDAGDDPKNLDHSKQFRPAERASILDMAATREIGKWGDSNNARMLEGACSVGNAYTIESITYPEAAGCYFDGSDGSGIAYGQELRAPGSAGELVGRGRMYAIPAPPRYSSISTSSSTTSWLSSITSSYTTEDLFGKAQVVWVHTYTQASSSNSETPLASIYCSALHPGIGLGHPTEVTEWTCGSTLIDQLSNEDPDLVKASESDFSVKCGCDPFILGTSSGNRVGGGSQPLVHHLLCLSALAAAVMLSVVL